MREAEQFSPGDPEDSARVLEHRDWLGTNSKSFALCKNKNDSKIRKNERNHLDVIPGPEAPEEKNAETKMMKETEGDGTLRI